MEIRKRIGNPTTGHGERHGAGSPPSLQCFLCSWCHRCVVNFGQASKAMRNLLWCGLAFLGLLAVPDGAAAQGLSLASRPNDLNNLKVGQIVEVDVLTNGFSGEELDSLGGSVFFGRELRANETNTAASIVPDMSDLTSTVGPGFVDGIFFSIDSSNGITDNGVFYKFSLEAVSLGSGTIRFQPGSLFSFVTGENNARPLSTSGVLNFTVVPEPNVLAIILMGAMAGTCRRVGRALRDG